MRFYVCNDEDGQVFDCALTCSEAKRIVNDACKGQGTVTRLEVAVTAENMRRLLGRMGGYAKEIHTVYVQPMPEK